MGEEYVLLGKSWQIKKNVKEEDIQPWIIVKDLDITGRVRDERGSSSSSPFLQSSCQWHTPLTWMRRGCECQSTSSSLHCPEKKNTRYITKEAIRIIGRNTREKFGGWEKIDDWKTGLSDYESSSSLSWSFSLSNETVKHLPLGSKKITEKKKKTPVVDLTTTFSSCLSRLCKRRKGAPQMLLVFFFEVRSERKRSSLSLSLSFLVRSSSSGLQTGLL
jgi:hypothetical protein